MNYGNFQRLWRLFSQKQKLLAIRLFFVLVIGMSMEILGIALIIPAFTLILQEDILDSYPLLLNFLTMFSEPTRENFVVLGIALMIFIFVLKNIYLAFQYWMQAGFSLRILKEFSHKLLDIYLNHEYKFHIKHNSALLLRNITNEIELMSASVITPMINLFAEVLVVIGIMGFLFYLEPLGLAGVSLVIILTSLCYSKLTKRHIQNWGEERQDSAGHRLRYMKEALEGIKDIKLLGREDFYLSNFNQHNLIYTKVAKKHNTLLQIPRLWLEVLAISSLSLLVLVQFFKEVQSVEIISAIAVFAFAAFRLMPSVNRIISSIQSLQYGLPVIEILDSEFNKKRNPLEKPNLTDIKFEKDIEFKDLIFSYEGSSKNSIDKLSLIIKKGESIGIIGSSGSGKSTFVDLLLGLLKPIQGKILIDGIELSENTRSWQDKIGYVPQNIFLSDDTVKNNIAFGLDESQIDDLQITNVINETQLSQTISELNEKENTKIGEGGIKFSGGQRQRIGIARALYHNPSILVLDEATSALDADTEIAIQEAVNKLKGKKTLIIIAHRLSTLSGCDKIIKIENGNIVMEGKPSDFT